jgi:poly(A) polymerase
MIKKLINRLLGKGEPAAAPQVGVSAQSALAATSAAPVAPLGVRVEVPFSEHRIDASLLDANAVRVVKTLKDAGFETYIVGGAVRDLLVGMRPKDFDVATSATPEQVKALFRRAFIIGRRFRLVHVVFGRGREHETIEVSTFRAYLDVAAADTATTSDRPAGDRHNKNQSADKTHVVDAAGRVLRDNVWGPQVEDAARRDFTINAMYYDPISQLVVDYHGGLADIRARLLRMIGDPETRYREDPVRIIRLVRFAAKLGFALEKQTEKPLRDMAQLLANVPLSRLFDEMVKLLQTGHALASIEQLKRFGLVAQPKGGVFPVLDAALSAKTASPTRELFVRLALQDTDKRVAEGRSVAPSFLLASLLWHDVQARWTALRGTGLGPMPALQQAVDAVFEARIGDISGRGKLGADMREIWLMQPRLERRAPASALALANQPRFRAGYDFLRLRADSGELGAPAGVELADWWEDFHLGSEDEREALLLALRNSPGGRGRKGSGAAAASTVDITVGDDDREGDGESLDNSDEGDGEEGGHDADGTTRRTSGGATGAPRKRRRRRRKPGGGGDPGSSSSNSGGNTPAAP